MAEIIYFGTNGCFGHYPIGIDKTLTGAECEIWRECDNEAYNGYGCFMFCDDRIKCKYRNKFDNRIKKAISLTK